MHTLTRKWWNHDVGYQVIQLMPGGYHVGHQQERILTVLGSCVAACIHAPDIGMGGMNHFMLPGNEESNSTRYGDNAMTRLIQTLIERGGHPQQLEAKIFGGAAITHGHHSKLQHSVGSRNIAFAREYLQQHNITLVKEDVGGHWPRKVYFNPASNDVLVKKLPGVHS